MINQLAICLPDLNGFQPISTDFNLFQPISTDLNLFQLFCAEGGTRTLTTLRSQDFKSGVSTIPPPRQSRSAIIPFSQNLAQGHHRL